MSGKVIWDSVEGPSDRFVVEELVHPSLFGRVFLGHESEWVRIGSYLSADGATREARVGSFSGARTRVIDRGGHD